MRTDAIELARRAMALRHLATRLDALPLDDLWRVSGSDTWIGPVPDKVRVTIEDHRRRVRAAADDLRCTARRLDSMAAAAARSQ